MSQPSTVAALRSLAGDQAQTGWQELVDQHGADIWRLILSRSRDAHEAEDVYQDFWLGLPRSAVSFRPSVGADPERSARAWLMRVAYTTAIDRVRRRRPGTVDASSGAAMDHADPQLAQLLVEGPERPGTGELHDRELLLQRVQGALNQLPETYRRPLLLYVVAGLSYEDLAADLRCTVNNARVRVHRSLKRLRDLLGGNAALMNERSLAGLIVPVLLAVPPAPSFALASTAASGSAMLGSSSGSAAGGAKVLGTPLIIGGAVLTAGVAATIALGPAPSVAPPTVPAVEPLVRVLDDFNRPTLNIDGHSFTKVPPELSLTPAPSGSSGNALRFGWNTAHTRWIDCEYADADKLLLKDVIPDVHTVITMRVWAPQTTRLQTVGLRLVDQHGEIFEWRRPLPDAGQTGWRTLNFALDPSAAATWDHRQSANQIIDVPLRLYGYSVAMGSVGSSEGVVIIDEVTLHPPAAVMDLSPTP